MWSLVSKFLAALLIVFTYVACGPAMHTTFSGPDYPAAENYKATELSYASVNDRVLRMNCISCHGQSGGINLESFPDVKANLSRISKAVLVSRTMPKAPGHLSPDQLGLLNAWIKAGAPETTNGGVAPIPLAPTFESIRYNILEPKCLQCHAPGKAVARIPLVTLNDLINSPLEIVLPGNPEESGIMIAVKGLNPNKIMPPFKHQNGLPTGFAKLSDVEISALNDWITNGPWSN